ncbi:MAG: flagellar hook-associated protein FlgK, partial [Gammaproteobacteria bacterium]
MSSGVLGTATSGLLAFQRALSTTGHNIANVNTPGYSRQRVEFETQSPQISGAGYIGTGVKTDSIVRMYDQFLVDRVRTSTASSSGLAMYSEYAGRVANVLGDADAGLNGALENFFNALQAVANNPTSVPERQVLLSEADSLVTRFQYLDSQLSATRNEVNAQMGAMVGEINTLSQSIASINKEIVIATGRAGGQPPNDLLDTRDVLLEKLSSLVSISTLAQDDGAVNVFIGNGQSLVTGFDASTLSVAGSAYDATRKEILISAGSTGAAATITGTLSGGKLGGLLDFRDEILEPAQNSLGRIAVVMGTEFNLQHALGMDLDGDLGGNFFNLTTPQVSAHTANGGSGTVSVSFDSANIDALTINDYVMSYDGTNWSLADMDGNAVTMTGLGTAGSPFVADGLRIVVGGAPDPGDRFQIRPTRDGGEDIGLAIAGVRDIAAAAPVRI